MLQGGSLHWAPLLYMMSDVIMQGRTAGWLVVVVVVVGLILKDQLCNALLWCVTLSHSQTLRLLTSCPPVIIAWAWSHHNF